ncbi:uncharacterized protein MONBRDRAFT_39273 [Monosiga brevicollis MX1]|uniref:Syntaxin-8 n=1 Tax=Monosiga brevicollis TaxID=81824 RepID=A9VDF0_MONBE|nr:uncharacterized protein MONBRDRAFT_39273 [Monosiga brevicollis MX1]EDQ84461.1 predicted protein [Monosiga brevicollis MX1]|eukprot:XP_001750756.1 hypothetical protein [Monosiga brevicollis MX1]
MSSRWLDDFDAAQALANDIQAACTERTRLRNKGQNATGATNAASNGLKRLAPLLDKLQKQLENDASSYAVTAKEADRRQNQLRQLNSRFKTLEGQFGQGNSNSAMSSDYHRNALYGSAGGRAPVEDEYTRGQDTQALLQEQDRIMDEQDRGLSTISASAQRLKQVGMAIGDELDDQNEMLDELGQGMDITDRRLKRETEHVVYVSEKAKAGGMFCCILLLIIAIIVVAAVPK